jgi:carbamoyltransferase
MDSLQDITMRILGVSCYFHDSAACLVEDGVVLAAAQEERFSREKHDPNFPVQAIDYCLRTAGLEGNGEGLDAVVFYEKPLLKFDRILQTHFREWPRSRRSFLDMQESWLGKKLRIRSEIKSRLPSAARTLFTRHHEAHAASAFYASPFSRAAVVTVDGVGEWTSTAIFQGRENEIRPHREICFPHSLGLFYSAFTDYLGFEVNDGEYKVMGLASYGKPRYVDALKSFLKIQADGSFSLNEEQFSFASAERLLDFNRAKKILGVAARASNGAIEEAHRDLAASVQALLEDALVALVKTAISLTGERKVCLAGGVALNCVANSRILRESGAEDVFVFPAAGDAGAAAGAALSAYYKLSSAERRYDSFPNAYLGPEFTQAEIDVYLQRARIPHRKLDEISLIGEIARHLGDQKIVGWFQGRMEFGPRALGNRSILADAMKKENWSRVNRSIKFREDFRPLAPIILEECTSEFFDFDRPSPYMLFVANEKTGRLPAVTHVDGTARVQTISREQNPRLHALLSEFNRICGVPALINTSFNTAGMPIVCTPQNAFQCFVESDLDTLVLGNCVVERAALPWIERGRR